MFIISVANFNFLRIDTSFSKHNEDQKDIFDPYRILKSCTIEKYYFHFRSYIESRIELNTIRLFFFSLKIRIHPFNENKTTIYLTNYPQKQKSSLIFSLHLGKKMNKKEMEKLTRTHIYIYERCTPQNRELNPIFASCYFLNLCLPRKGGGRLN